MKPFKLITFDEYKARKMAQLNKNEIRYDKLDYKSTFESNQSKELSNFAMEATEEKVERQLEQLDREAVSLDQI